MLVYLQLLTLKNLVLLQFFQTDYYVKDGLQIELPHLLRGETVDGIDKIFERGVAHLDRKKRVVNFEPILKGKQLSIPDGVLNILPP